MIACKIIIENRWLASSVRMIVLASAGVLMIPGAWDHSVTIVELAQLPAGLAALQHHKLGIYRVCGPVSKLLYALPAYTAGIRVNVPNTYDFEDGVRHEWDLGKRFQNEARESYHAIYRWSRLFPILVTILGGVLICEWATRLFGTWPGITSLCIWCWLPPILAHGSLVTSDMAAAVILLCAARTFWSFLLGPSLMTALLAGLTLGLAVATKFTLIAVYPCWLVLLVGRALLILRAREADPALRPAPFFRLRPAPFLRFIILGFFLFTSSVVAIDAAYGFRDIGFHLAQWQSGRSSLSGELHKLAETSATAWMLQIPVPIPLELLRGLDVQLADTERVQSAYLFGQTQLGGWWYWYPVAALIKLPIPALLLLTLSLIRIPNAGRVNDSIFWASLCLLIPAADLAFVVAASTGTGTNAAFRYQIPSIALCCVWAGGALGAPSRLISGELTDRRKLVHRLSIIVMLTWLLLNAVIALPDHLGWQNEVGWAFRHWSGRPALIGDSLDWGQDLARLGKWVAHHTNEGSTVICVYGMGTGVPYGLQPPAARSSFEPGDNPAYLAISEDILHGYGVKNSIQVADGRTWLNPDQRAGLLRLQPFALIGRTIRIYRLRDIPARQWFP
jgi:hypothetical protein